jgi:anti-sigma factor ChrR (cupin superfamily)
MPAQLYEELVVRTSEMEWIPFADGISYKILRVSPESGVWTVIFHCEKGSAFAPHVHYGAGEYLMLSGVMDYRMGVAHAGDYGYEPLGVYHDRTNFLEDTDIWFTNHGPIAFVDEEGAVISILDWKFFADQLVDTDHRKGGALVAVGMS